MVADCGLGLLIRKENNSHICRVISILAIMKCEGSGHKSDEDSLRELGLLSLEKRGLRLLQVLSPDIQEANPQTLSQGIRFIYSHEQRGLLGGKSTKPARRLQKCFTIYTF